MPTIVCKRRAARLLVIASQAISPETMRMAAARSLDAIGRLVVCPRVLGRLLACRLVVGRLLVGWWHVRRQLGFRLADEWCTRGQRARGRRRRWQVGRG